MTSWSRGVLPDADEVVKCATHARDHEYDPGGTAIAANVLLVVDLPLPWPKPVTDHPLIAGISTTAVTPRGPARMLAAIPAADGRLRLRRFDRTPGGAVVATSDVNHPPDLSAAIRRELSAAKIPPGATPLTTPTVLVCTQGTHDVCCGIEGTRFAIDLKAAAGETDVVRVSHTGGHRFAPTAMTLPDGRMWASLDVATYLAIRDRTVSAGTIAGRCRGWWGAAPGPAQIAERAVFAAAGWSWERRRRTVDHDAADANLWQVTSDGGTWKVRVDAERDVPVLSCRSPGGLPVKRSTEYRATIVARP